jgi:hypothetical protein
VIAFADVDAHAGGGSADRVHARFPPSWVAFVSTQS